MSKSTLSKKETAKRDHYIHGEGYDHRRELIGGGIRNVGKNGCPFIFGFQQYMPKSDAEFIHGVVDMSLIGPVTSNTHVKVSKTNHRLPKK